jgi:cobalamin biosynthesis protein CobT
MRYTHFGIGHSATLRRIIRDSLGSHSVAGANTTDVVSIEDEASDGEGDDVEGLEECEDEQEDDDVEGFESEECDDDFSDGELDEEDSEGCADEFDEFDDISF